MLRVGFITREVLAHDADEVNYVHGATSKVKL